MLINHVAENEKGDRVQYGAKQTNESKLSETV
jgi:hypothetical protein